MKTVKTISTALLMSTLLAVLPGCMKKEGPAEKVGKSLDNAAESAGDQIENAGEVIQDAAEGETK